MGDIMKEQSYFKAMAAEICTSKKQAIDDKINNNNSELKILYNEKEKCKRNAERAKELNDLWLTKNHRFDILLESIFVLSTLFAVILALCIVLWIKSDDRSINKLSYNGIILSIIIIAVLYTIIIPILIKRRKTLRALDEEIKSLSYLTDDSKVVQDINEINAKNKNLEKEKAFYDVASQYNEKNFPIYNETILNYIYHDSDLYGEEIHKHLFGQLSSFSGCYQRNCLLTQNELSFYNDLLDVVTKLRYKLEIKVRLADIISVGEIGHINSYTYLQSLKIHYSNYIKSKHIDYVVYDSGFYPKLCIEIDDPSHYDDSDKKYSEEHIKSHIVKDIILSYCRIPLLRLDTSNVSDLKGIVTDALKASCVIYNYSDANIERFNASLNRLTYGT